MKDEDREQCGRIVRRVWVEWAREQPNPKPSWLLPWEELSEPDREVARRIGETLFRIGVDAGIALQACGCTRVEPDVAARTALGIPAPFGR
jgi:hypothetical protein